MNRLLIVVAVLLAIPIIFVVTWLIIMMKATEAPSFSATEHERGREAKEAILAELPEDYGTRVQIVPTHDQPTLTVEFGFKREFTSAELPAVYQSIHDSLHRHTPEGWALDRVSTNPIVDGKKVSIIGTDPDGVGKAAPYLGAFPEANGTILYANTNRLFSIPPRPSKDEVRAREDCLAIFDDLKNSARELAGADSTLTVGTQVFECVDQQYFAVQSSPAAFEERLEHLAEVVKNQSEPANFSAFSQTDESLVATAPVVWPYGEVTQVDRDHNFMAYFSDLSGDFG